MNQPYPYARSMPAEETFEYYLDFFQEWNFLGSLLTGKELKQLKNPVEGNKQRIKFHIPDEIIKKAMYG